MATNVTDKISDALPYLRRYARALTGSQSTGDRYAATTLEAVLADRSLLAGEMPVKVGLFRVFQTIWTSGGKAFDDEEDPRRRAAQRHLAKLTENSREALLLRTIEGFNREEIASILSVSPEEASDLVTRARGDMALATTGKVMIIEDETIIALDIKSLVSEMGHEVTGIARTHAEAVALARSASPDLILADIQLADKSSGIEAVDEMMMDLGHCPVIFITAFPERLLLGAPKEPAFLIAKPYTQDQVQSAVSQAMFFATTDGMSL